MFFFFCRLCFLSGLSKGNNESLRTGDDVGNDDDNDVSNEDYNDDIEKKTLNKWTIKDKRTKNVQRKKAE